MENISLSATGLMVEHAVEEFKQLKVNVACKVAALHEAGFKKR
jgi:hypothetical protein